MMNDMKNNVVDISLDAAERRPVRFNNDDNRVVYLNVTDIGIVTRMSNIIPKLKEEQAKASKIMDDIDANDNDSEDKIIKDMSILSERLSELDKNMRNLLDEMFDAPVSAAAAPSGSMYDPIEGTFRYEYIADKLITLFGDNIEAEYKKAEKRIATHTAKYTKGKK